MRHRKSGRAFSRNSQHRKAMFSNMATSLINHEIIKTTLPKAKELRGYVERLITMAKTDSVAGRRIAFSKLRNKQSVSKLYNELGPRYQGRPGGYTRVLKFGYRTGDKAPMAIIELVDRPIESESELSGEFSEESKKLAEQLMAAAGESKQVIDVEPEKSETTIDTTSDKEIVDNPDKSDKT